MMIFTRIVFFLLCLTLSSAVYADEALMQSQRELDAAYEVAVGQVKMQKPNLLGALQTEQDDWLNLREKHCAEANANLPSKYDRQDALDFCKANMNRQRVNVLQGKRANGKDW